MGYTITHDTHAKQFLQPTGADLKGRGSDM